MKTVCVTWDHEEYLALSPDDQTVFDNAARAFLARTEKLGAGALKIYTDGTHLWAPNIAILHEFAGQIGRKAEWFQVGKRSHYDLTTPTAANRAIKNGAVKITSRELVKLMKNA